MSRVILKKISIVDIDTDCVVNAANSGLKAGGGVCGAIFRAAGYEELTKACSRIGGCKTGGAVITPAFNMKQKYIIHAVGPIWMGGGEGEAYQLRSAYRSALDLAVDNNCASIGFPLISAGIYGYPVQEAWRVALEAVYEFLKDIKDSGYNIDIYFAALDDQILWMGKEELDRQQSMFNAWAGDPVFFWNADEENGFLSQWFSAQMSIDGVTYNSCEQYMMAKKALAMGDVEYYILIMHEKDPAKVKKLGRGVRNFDSEKWSRIAPKVIYDGNLAKFSQNEDLKDKLMATGDSLLAEASPTDLRYGIGLTADDPDAKIPSKWKGKNLMGETLMRVREELGRSADE